MQESALSAHAAMAHGAEAVVRRRPNPRLLHVLNGDAAVDRLRSAGIFGQFTLSADVLYEGPVTVTSSAERSRRERARFLAESGYGDYEECLTKLTGWDRALEDFRSHDEVVLWFEHDLFDQLHLCRLLAWFSGRDRGLTELSVVQAHDYLGELPPRRLAGLFEARQPASEAQTRLGRNAWEAFCAADPTRLEALSRTDTSPLPFLAGALRRHLEEFPAAGDGLSRTERQLLSVLVEGPLRWPALFAAAQRLEESVFMTDLSLLRRLRELASGPRPVLRIESQSASSPLTATAALTGVGLGVLAGREDWIEIRGGIDCWLGGVHLRGREAAWRWDRAVCRLVPAARQL